MDSRKKTCRRFLSWQLIGLAMVHEGRGEEFEVFGSRRNEAADQEESGIDDGDRGCCGSEEKRQKWWHMSGDRWRRRHEREETE